MLGDKDSQSKRGKRSYTYADFMSSNISDSKDNAAHEGKVIVFVVREVPRIKEEILRTTFVVQRIFLCSSRSSNGINDKGMYIATE